MGIPGKIKKKLRRLRLKENRRLKKLSAVYSNKYITINRQMENLVINAEEHKILKMFREHLEKRFKVRITMPQDESLNSDVVFVTIEGVPPAADYVKRFLAEKMKESVCDDSPKEDGIDLITLSDTESDNESDICVIDLDSEDEKPDQNLTIVKSEPLDDSVCVVNHSTDSSDSQKIASGEQAKGKKRKHNYMKVRSRENSSKASGLCEVSSTTDIDMVKKKPKLSDSVLIIEEPASSNKRALDFIPLTSEGKSLNKKNEPQPSDEPVAPRRLRPIVIDGSNVAMEHGRTTRTFSVKGIKLAIDYFLNRGHTQVTAFVPKFRRNRNPNRSVPTTDVDIFDELERQQHVVFTPSRRVDGKNITSYDDRFIVQLATTNGGVIVSNDNYRDLLEENESFKEAITQRLLMFCFVGDVFMVPDDPLGRKGPKLADYLSFPPDNQIGKEEEDKE